MTLSEWLTLASSLGALGAATISLFTLFELFRQRKASYKPDICVLKRYFTIRGEGVGKTGIPTSWFRADSELGEMASIQLVNIGVGAAKHIGAKWHFDQSSLVKEINKLAQEAHESFYIQEEGSFLSVKNNSKNGYMVNAQMNDFAFEYLLPASQDETGLVLSLPPSYSFLLSLLIGLSFKVREELPDIKSSSIGLSLTYSDIGKNKHSSNHIIRIELSAIQRTDSSMEFSLSLVEGS
ncbi:hypothetical protein K2B98_004732 [Vibrio parahaemolyticus]|nr:hypothetical protein [Vibrio parahaemolyticus]EGQ9499274.1 hypothetical protein [Vibrio parahaemolyticus]EGQ9507884.1 hypothetical protein [Vibrio parahaemolyticus]EGQ9814279.1 hypothetical protein [Vibrio parahaemolyticus]EGR0045836.1 hypothetical protein [Vibrio parahaemolyticus]